MSGPRVSLEQWRALLAVVDRGGYAQAAEFLNKSQSAATYAIQQLERQLAVKALVVQGRKAVLTPTGRLLVRRARALLEDAGALEQAAQRLSAGWEAELRISVDVIFPTWLLLRCLADLGAETPHTRIELTESVLGDRSDALARGEADVAIFPSVPPGFVGAPLLRVRFLAVAAPAHPLHGLGRNLTLRDLSQHRQLVVRESSPERATRPSVAVAMRWTVGHMATSIDAVVAGHGFAYLPEHRIRGELASGALVPLRLAEAGERYAELYLIVAGAADAGPAALRLSALLRETVARECRDEERSASPTLPRADA